MERRAFMIGLMGLTGLARVPRVAGSGSVIRIGIWIDSSAQGQTEHVEDLCNLIESVFGSAMPGVRVIAGPEGVVTVPESKTVSAEQTARWWRGQQVEGDMDARLLLMPHMNDVWRHGRVGYGFEGAAVASGISGLYMKHWQHLALHEVGHALGLDHAHARHDSIMTTPIPVYPTMELSPQSVMYLRSKYQ